MPASDPVFNHGSRFAFPVLLVILALAFLWVFARINESTTANREAIRTVLCLAEDNVQHEKGLSDKQRRDATAFYTRALKGIGAQPCHQGP